MFTSINSILFLDLIWLPLFLSIFFFIFMYILMNEFFFKILNFRNYVKKNKNKFLKDNFFNDYYSLIKFIYKFTIYIYILLFYNFCYFYTYNSNFIFFNFQIFNYTWIYTLLLNIFIIILLLILLNLYSSNLIKSFEFLLSLTFFFNCLFYYVLLNNLIVLIFLFEFQSIVFIYLLSNSFTLKIAANQNLLLTYSQKNLFNTWYFNGLIYQYWVSFIGALLLIYTSLNWFKLTSFNEWYSFEAYLYIFNLLNKYYSFYDLIFLILPLILGLSLKLGSIPFFLWKPEIYKNFNIIIVFIYMGIYLFSVMYFCIILFNNYICLLQKYVYIYIYMISIFSLIFLSLIIYSIVEIRPFLAYTSILHIVFVLLTILVPSINSSSIGYFYLFIYFYSILFLFLILFSIKNTQLWYFTDFQYYFKHTIFNTMMAVILLSMAGLPPFIGFFAKFSVISLLFFNQEYLLFFLTLFFGLFISFFYIQNYRFYGFNIKNLNFKKNIFLLKYNKNYFFFMYIFMFFNVFSFFFLNDLFIFFTYISLK